MSDFTPRHWRVLRVLSEGFLRPGADGGANYGDFTPDHVSERIGMSEELAHQCLINLAGAGLATTVSVLGAMAYPITELGRAVVLAAGNLT